MITTRSHTIRTLAASALITLALWTCFTWPLPREVFNAMPYAARVPGPQVGLMLPGDHLQLLYHFWLFDDMLRGDTPWFHNLYEFNTGNDAARREPGTYYLPFSAFFTLGDRFAGRAFGWNFAGFCALWLGYLFSVLLARRYTSTRGVAWIAALPCLLIPFRWDALLGGSPLGFAMMWIPALLLGLDLAVRESRIRGGLLAGFALIGACVGDLHVLAFAIFATPVACLIALLIHPSFRWTPWKAFTKDAAGIALALTPVLLGAAVVAALRHAASSDLATSTMGRGRDLSEVLIFSPNWKGLFLRGVIPVSNHIYLGFAAPLLIALGAARFLAMGSGLNIQYLAPGALTRNWRNVFLLFATLAITAVVIVLALGPRDPLGGHLFNLIRKFVPPYAMIRQPAKIFCLMPPLLTILLALTLPYLTALRTTRAWRPAILTLAVALMLLDFRPLIRPGITLLQRDQGAYAAVARDAASHHAIPRALVIALWPGDTHYTAIYQYFASRYHIRMVNGYSPVVSRDYKDKFFPSVVSLNQGYATAAQLDDLLTRGIRHLLVHEDLFPEKVSPFPITFTLKNLLTNPRLEFLTRDDAVWAFRITEAPHATPAIGTNWTTWFPTRRWEAEKGPHRGTLLTNDTSATGNAALALHTPIDYVGIHPTAISPAPNLRFLARVRGHGQLESEFLADTFTPPSLAPITINSPAWSWIEIPAPALSTYTQLGLKLHNTANSTVDLDTILLTAGPWTISPAPNETISLPAPIFFHAGHIDTNANTVVFTRGAYAGGVWYGPNLPLTPGTYTITLDTTIDAPPGTHAGFLRVSADGAPESATPVIAGHPTTVTLHKTGNLSLLVVFDYTGTHDTTLHHLTLTRHLNQSTSEL